MRAEALGAVGMQAAVPYVHLAENTCARGWSHFENKRLIQRSFL